VLESTRPQRPTRGRGEPAITRALAVFAAALLLVTAAIAAGCGGGGDTQQLTLEEYFRQTETVIQGSFSRLNGLEDQYPGALEDPEATRDFFDEALALISTGADQLAAINPPEEVWDVHNEALNAIEDFREIAEDFADRLADIDSASELVQFLDEATPAIQAAQAQVAAPCLELEDIAARNGIDVDLDCPG
jgi:hypothetical protein